MPGGIPKLPNTELHNLKPGDKLYKVNDPDGLYAHQISLVFDIEIDNDLVPRVLARRYKPDPAPTVPRLRLVLASIAGCD